MCCGVVLILFGWFLSGMQYVVICSLVPRPSPAPVFDRLQYCKRSKTGAGEGLGTRLVICIPSLLGHAFQCLVFASTKFCTNLKPGNEAM